MNVTTEQLREIKPGTTVAFVCDDAAALYSACSLVTRLKRFGMPDGIVNYETQKFFSDVEKESVILIHAMKEGDEFVLNR